MRSKAELTITSIDSEQSNCFSGILTEIRFK